MGAGEGGKWGSMHVAWYGKLVCGPRRGPAEFWKSGVPLESEQGWARAARTLVAAFLGWQAWSSSAWGPRGSYRGQGAGPGARTWAQHVHAFSCGLRHWRATTVTNVHHRAVMKRLAHNTQAAQKDIFQPPPRCCMRPATSLTRVRDPARTRSARKSRILTFHSAGAASAQPNRTELVQFLSRVPSRCSVSQATRHPL